MVPCGDEDKVTILTDPVLRLFECSATRFKLVFGYYMQLISLNKIERCLDELYAVIQVLKIFSMRFMKIGAVTCDSVSIAGQLASHLTLNIPQIFGREKILHFVSVDIKCLFFLIICVSGRNQTINIQV